MLKTSRLRSALTLGSSLTALLAAAPALAQTTSVGEAPQPVQVAANAQPRANPPGGASTALPEVIVTAEKRAANIQNVPVAVTAFTAKDRALKGINTVQDLTNFTPGLTYSSQLDRPAIRGLQRSTNVYLADSSVGVYDNDLFTNSTFLVGRDDMIVDQVEVLEGPQNTLYGRNAIGGIINTQSKRPYADSYGGEVREEFGNYGYNKIEATVTGPLSFINPNLSFRFSGFYDSQDQGWIRNLTGKDTEGARHDPYVELQLQYKGDRDDLWFETYYITFNQDRGGPGSSIGTPGTGPYNVSLVPDGALFYNPNFPYGGGAVPGSVVGEVPGGQNPSTIKNRITAFRPNTSINVDDASAYNFHWTHHFDNFDVKYVGGYSQYHYQQFENNFLSGDSSIISYQIPTATLAQVPPTSGNFCGTINAVGGACAPLTVDEGQVFTFDATIHWYSHELDFTSTSKGPFSWIAGLYYYNEHDNNPETEQAPNQPQLNGTGFNTIPLTGAAGYIPTLFGTLAGGPAPGLSIFNPNEAGDFAFLDYQSIIQSTAGFVQGSYKITDELKLTGGFRYTYDRKDGEEEARYIDFANVLPASLLGQFTPAVDITPLLISTAPGKGIASPVSFPTTGKYAGDATRHLADESSAPTGTAALEWTPDRDTLAYVRYSRGYKAFAFNAGFVGPNPEAAPEFVNDYEVGLKKTINHNIQIDIDGFYYDYSNDQVPLTFPSPGSTVLLTQFVNIPKAVSDGVEVQALWSPVPHLNLSLTYGFDHTEILTNCAAFTTPLATATGGCFIDGADPLAQAQGAKPRGPSTVAEPVTGRPEVFQSVKGDELPQSPENKVAFNATYTWFFTPGNLILSGSYIWRDHDFSSIFTRTQYDYAPSWSQVDARLTWSGNHDKYEVVVYVKNLFNTIGFDDAAGGAYNQMPQGGGGPTYSPTYDLTPPRLFGAEIHYKF